MFQKTSGDQQGVSGGWAIAHSVFVRIEDAAGHRRCAALLAQQILGSPWNRAWPKTVSYLVRGVNSYLKLDKKLLGLPTNHCWKCTEKFWENIFNFSSGSTRVSTFRTFNHTVCQGKFWIKSKTSDKWMMGPLHKIFIMFFKTNRKIFFWKKFGSFDLFLLFSFQYITVQKLWHAHGQKNITESFSFVSLKNLIWKYGSIS